MNQKQRRSTAYENKETIFEHPAQPCAGAWTDAGDADGCAGGRCAAMVIYVNCNKTLRFNGVILFNCNNLTVDACRFFSVNL